MTEWILITDNLLVQLVYPNVNFPAAKSPHIHFGGPWTMIIVL